LKAEAPKFLSLAAFGSIPALGPPINRPAC